MFIRRLTALMAEKKITRKQLTDDLSFGKNQIKYWEDHGNVPRIEILTRIAEYLNTTVEYLTGQVDHKEKPAASDELLSDPQNREFLELYSLLTPEERQFVLAAIKGILSKR